MEALLEREEKVESWNDDRLDELNQGIKEGFARSDREMKEGFAKVDRRFERIDDRLDKLFYIQILFLISFSAALITHNV
jgi:glutathionyl-hydroquinone reductase